MKTKEEVINDFLERNCAFAKDSKVWHRVNSQLVGVWKNGWHHGNQLTLERMKAEHQSGYEEGLKEGRGQTADYKWNPEEAYKKGFRDGKSAVTPLDTDSFPKVYDLGFEEGYDNGKIDGERDAIETVKRLFKIAPEKDFFDGYFVEDILNLYTYEDIKIELEKRFRNMTKTLTNAEKFEEVFGFEPIYVTLYPSDKFWNEEYKSNDGTSE